MTVAGGRTLTLVAHCKETVMEGFSAYGTGTIDVLDGEELLQTLHVGEGVLMLEENPEASSEEVLSHGVRILLPSHVGGSQL